MKISIFISSKISCKSFHVELYYYKCLIISYSFEGQGLISIVLFFQNGKYLDKKLHVFTFFVYKINGFYILLIEKFSPNNHLFDVIFNWPKHKRNLTHIVLSFLSKETENGYLKRSTVLNLTVLIYS